MQVFHSRSVRKARKQRVCSWCGESIALGDAYESYRWRDRNDYGHETLHEECMGVMHDLAAYEGCGFYWTHGEFVRGTSQCR